MSHHIELIRSLDMVEYNGRGSRRETNRAKRRSANKANLMRADFHLKMARQFPITLGEKKTPPPSQLPEFITLPKRPESSAVTSVGEILTPKLQQIAEAERKANEKVLQRGEEELVMELHGYQQTHPTVAVPIFTGDHMEIQEVHRRTRPLPIRE